MTQHTNMNEKSLEDIIVAHLVHVNGYEQGDGKNGSIDYNTTMCADEVEILVRPLS